MWCNGYGSSRVCFEQHALCVVSPQPLKMLSSIQQQLAERLPHPVAHSTPSCVSSSLWTGRLLDANRLLRVKRSYESTHTHKQARARKPAPVGECRIDCEKGPEATTRPGASSSVMSLGQTVTWSMFETATLEGNQMMIWHFLLIHQGEKKCSNTVLMCWNRIYWLITKHLYFTLFHLFFLHWWSFPCSFTVHWSCSQCSVVKNY